MTTYSLVKNGTVENCIVLSDPASYTPPDGYELIEGGQIGDMWDGEAFVRPEQYPMVAPPPALEPWQFYAVLDISGHRAALDAFIDNMEEPARAIAKAKLLHAKSFNRDNELVMAAQAALDLTDAELDALWEYAAGLS